MFLTNDDKIRQYPAILLFFFHFLSANAMATASEHTVYHVYLKKFKKNPTVLVKPSSKVYFVKNARYKT
jgi:hypothetical protein